MAPDLEAMVRELYDKQKIREAPARYCRGVDRMDRALFLRYLAHVGPGWIDIHASRVDPPADLRVRKLAELGSELLQQVGMRLGSDRMTAWGRKLWGIG